jgi:exodeoxyribonuclease V alpha subunit
MTDALSLPDALRRLFPEAGPELSRLLAAVEQEGGLLYSDYVTIRDLLDLSGYGEHEPLHVLLVVMLLALEDGSVCVELRRERIEKRLGDAGVAEEAAAYWGQRVIQAVEQNGFRDLIGTQLSDAKPLLLIEKAGRPLLYFHKFLHAEEAVERELTRLLGRTPDPSPPTPLPRRRGRGGPSSPSEGLGLNPRQQQAVNLALQRDFVIITGGPGTGKTTVVFTLLRCLVGAGVPPEGIALAAPTGRAAQRLAESIQHGLTALGEHAEAADAAMATLEPATLHRLLRYSPASNAFRHNAQLPLEADVVVVDEVSMVGIDLMAQFLEAVGPRTKLILLGDRDQLPSVDAGAVLADLTAMRASSLAESTVVLEENYRSEQSILAAAHAVNAQDASLVERLPRWRPGSDTAEPGVWLLEQEDDAFSLWRKTLLAHAEAAFLTPAPGGDSYCDLARERLAGNEFTAGDAERLTRLFALLDRAKILTLLRDGPWGASGVNELLARHLRGKFDPRGPQEQFAGAPVLITRNDPERQLYNGDVGITLRGSSGYRAAFRVAGRFVTYPVDSLPAHELAFALTVHKSQGSEYDQVLFVLPPEGGRRLLTKELVYTAITRAKRRVIVWARPDVLREAIARKVERESGMRLASPARGRGDSQLRLPFDFAPPPSPD